MHTYTLCFVKRGNQLLMLNRNSAPAKGLWNGVGGKVEKGESPVECIIRETFEETGIQLEEAVYKGIVNWDVDDSYSGGMYTFIAEVPEHYEYVTPKKVDEGLLDWKEIEWILSEHNSGVGEAIPRFLPLVLFDEKCYEHTCTIVNNKLVEYQMTPLASLSDAELMSK